MTPEQAHAHAALLLIRRLVRTHGLTVEEAVTAVTQQKHRQPGPHTHLVVVEANAMVEEAVAPIRKTIEKLAEAFHQLATTAGGAMAELAHALEQASGRRRDRPGWMSPYGPPPSRTGSRR